MTRLTEPEHEAREFTCHFDEDGMLVLRGRLTPEDGAAYMKVLNAMVSALNSSVARSEQSEEEIPEKSVSAETFRCIAGARRACNVSDGRGIAATILCRKISGDGAHRAQEGG